jgi:F420-dependent methylenetetrahydromethanopterin dehydrogenase
VGHGGFPEFRDDIDAVAVDPNEPVTGDYKWRRLDAKNLVPSGIILDGPNPYVKDHEHEYQPHGYLTLEFDNDRLKEIYRLPDGTVVRTQTL